MGQLASDASILFCASQALSAARFASSIVESIVFRVFPGLDESTNLLLLMNDWL